MNDMYPEFWTHISANSISIIRNVLYKYNQNNINSITCERITVLDAIDYICELRTLYFMGKEYLLDKNSES